VSLQLRSGMLCVLRALCATVVLYHGQWVTVMLKLLIASFMRHLYNDMVVAWLPASYPPLSLTFLTYVQTPELTTFDFQCPARA